MCKSQRTRTGRRAEAKKVISLFQRTMSGQTVSEVTTNTFNIIFEENIETTKIVLAGPLCSAPPEIPFEGSVEVIPGTFQLQPIASCQVKKDSGHVALHFTHSHLKETVFFSGCRSACFQCWRPVHDSTFLPLVSLGLPPGSHSQSTSSSSSSSQLNIF